MENEPFNLMIHQIFLIKLGKADLFHDGAIVLERKARAGGATNWYYCQDRDQLGTLAGQMSPGSLVSFYFDGRITKARASPAVVLLMDTLVRETNELLVGLLSQNCINLRMQEISGLIELKEFLAEVNNGSQIFFGVFPAPDDDGVNALTVVLPDRDGITRSHPH